MLGTRHVGALLIIVSVILMIFIGITKVGIDQRDVFLCSEVAQDPNLQMEDCPAHNSNTSWALMVSFGFVFVILVAGIYLLISPVKSKKEEKPDLSMLDEDEMEIYDLIKDNDGSMYQGNIVKHTEFSKVKVSRILDRMVQKKVLEKKRRGMTNLVVLL